MKPGKILWADVPFAEMDGRAKRRPVIVLAAMTHQAGKVLLVAGKYSAAEKVRGSVEVYISAEDSELLGLDRKEGVFRFSRESVAAITADKVSAVVGDFRDLDSRKRESFRRAAKAVGIDL